MIDGKNGSRTGLGYRTSIVRLNPPYLHNPDGMLSILRSAAASAVFFLLLWGAAAQVNLGIANPCGNCSYSQAGYYGGWWTTASVQSTTSIEAVTLVVTTGEDGTVGTSTIFNFPTSAAVPATNPAGYPVFTKTLTYGSAVITTTLTWPTGYVAYQTGQFWTGAIPDSPRTASQSSHSEACSTAPTGAFSSYNTVFSPVFPTPEPSPSSDVSYTSFDPALWWQWTFYDDQQADADCFGTYPTSVFPDYATLLPTFPIYDYCLPPSESVCAPVALQTVAYLTVTSHQTREDSTTAAPTSSIAAQISVTAVPVETSRGRTTTVGIVETTQAPSNTASTTAQPSTSTITVDSGDGGNIHNSRSIIRTSPLDASAAEASKRGAGSRAVPLAGIAWTVVGWLTLCIIA